MNTLAEIEAWLATFPTLVPTLKAVYFGDDEEIIEKHNSRVEYPFLWVESPTVNFLADPPAKAFTFGLAFLNKVGKSDRRLQRKILSETLELAERVFARLEADAEASDEFSVSLAPAEGDPIVKWSNDNAAGWRFEVRIEVSRCNCLDCDD